MRNPLKILLVLLASSLVHAHVGSPDVYYEGDAGSYHLFVTVRLPQVIPGVAEIRVRSASPEVRTVQVFLLNLIGPGSNLRPAPNIAQRSRDDPQFFVSNVWFLESGALQVRIEVNGSKGKAELSVPVASFARQSPFMNRGLRVILAFFFVFLTLSVAPIIAATVGESVVPLGKAPSAANRRRSQIVMVITLILAVVTLHLNRAWWNAEAATYARSVDLLKPPRAETTLLNGNRLVIRPVGRLMAPRPGMSDREVRMDELIPDHGYPMHLFLVASPAMQRMWHLHPDHAEGDAFVKRLPAMPAGQYQVFADILDTTGFPWTLVGKIDLPPISAEAAAGDDSGWDGAPLTPRVSDTTVAQLPDGARMVWERGNVPVTANVPASLNFRVEAKDNTPARDLQPYMGMAAHAEVVCSDWSVFAHIHPSGTVPMAALRLAQSGDTLHSSAAAPRMEMRMPMPGSSAPLPPDFSFAYGFPHPGDYRIFVQIKRSGEVQTAVFDTHVQ
jgi:hypothetical protein